MLYVKLPIVQGTIKHWITTSRLFTQIEFIAIQEKLIWKHDFKLDSLDLINTCEINLVHSTVLLLSQRSLRSALARIFSGGKVALYCRLYSSELLYTKTRLTYPKSRRNCGNLVEGAPRYDRRNAHYWAVCWCFSWRCGRLWTYMKETFLANFCKKDLPFAVPNSAESFNPE